VSANDPVPYAKVTILVEYATGALETYTMAKTANVELDIDTEGNDRDLSGLESLRVMTSDSEAQVTFSCTAYKEDPLGPLVTISRGFNPANLESEG